MRRFAWMSLLLVLAVLASGPAFAQANAECLAAAQADYQMCLARCSDSASKVWTSHCNGLCREDLQVDRERCGIGPGQGRERDDPTKPGGKAPNTPSVTPVTPPMTTEDPKKADCSKYAGLINRAFFNAQGSVRMQGGSVTFNEPDASTWSSSGPRSPYFGPNSVGRPGYVEWTGPGANEVIPLPAPRTFASADAALVAARASAPKSGPGGFIGKTGGVGPDIGTFGAGFGSTLLRGALGFGLGLVLDYMVEGVTGLTIMENIQLGQIPAECRPCLNCT